MMRFAILIAAAFAPMLASTATATPNEVAGADVIERVDRVLRVDADTAGTWHQGVSGLDAWPARLERGLLETLGPPELRDTEAGLTVLERLVDDPSSEVQVTAGARETLAVIVSLIRRQVSLARQRDRATRALDEEREAHRQTLDKLDALRAIDRQLDERENNGG